MYSKSMGKSSEPYVIQERCWWQAPETSEVTRKAFMGPSAGRHGSGRKGRLATLCAQCWSGGSWSQVTQSLSLSGWGVDEVGCYVWIPKAQITRCCTMRPIAVGHFPCRSFCSLNMTFSSSLFPLLLPPHLAQAGSKPGLTLFVGMCWEHSVCTYECRWQASCFPLEDLIKEWWKQKPTNQGNDTNTHCNITHHFSCPPTLEPFHI